MGHTPEAVRYLLAAVPYRNKLNFTMDGLKAAALSIERLRNFELRLKTDRFAGGVNDDVAKRTTEAFAQFEAAMDDDLNTANALGAVFEFIRETNTIMDAGGFKAGNVEAALALLSRMDVVFDILKPTLAEDSLDDAAIDALVAARNAAKKARDFARADALRAELLDKGIVLEDTKEGTRWKRK
jgi:cysteinyl-tRNA synthetase